MAIQSSSLQSLLRWTLCHSLLGWMVSAVLAESPAEVSSGSIGIRADGDAVVIRKGEGEALRYWLKKPADSTCVSPSASYFHPLTTPGGETVTDVAPDDHLHHRGVFLAWLDVRSEKAAGDFWGWGKFAPLEGRSIVARAAEDLSATPDSAAFRVRNEWMAEETVLLREDLHTTVRFEEAARVYDFDYRFASDEDLVLGQFAFCGFAVRTRKDGAITVHDPEGRVSLPNPSHLKPETDWPDRPWYALEIALASGKTIGVAVVNHPGNPPTLWHNVDKIGLLNPCIVAPGPVRIAKSDGLRLRYRVVCFDGPVPTRALDAMAASFGGDAGSAKP